MRMKFKRCLKAEAAKHNKNVKIFSVNIFGFWIYQSLRDKSGEELIDIGRPIEEILLFSRGITKQLLTGVSGNSRPVGP